MSRKTFEEDIEASITLLRNGGIILYPTDTIWGIGCDATNADAVSKIYQLKKRDDKKSMIILVTEERDILKYVAAPDPAVFQFIEQQTRPTTIIFENAIGLPHNLVADDGSIAIRLTRDEFCRHLIKRLQRPLVSTSANISGQPSPPTFTAVEDTIKNGVDYTVKWRQDDVSQSNPSRIIKWNNDGSHFVIRG